MEDTDPFRKYVDAGLALTQLTRARAEGLVKELVKAGELQRDHAQERVEELLERSRRTTDGLAAVIRKEMAQQLSSMGFATKVDLDKLEARIERRLTAMGATGPGTKAPAKTARKEASGKRAAKPATAPPGTAARKAAARNPGRRGAATGTPPARS